MRIHGARGRVGGIEIEGALFIHRTGSNPVIMAVALSQIASRKLVYRLCDGVEPMHDEVIAELMPPSVLAVLHADIDENKRLLQVALPDDPLGKRRIEIVGKLHRLNSPATRTVCGHACALPTSHSRAWGAAHQVTRRSVPRPTCSAAVCPALAQPRTFTTSRSVVSGWKPSHASLLAFRPACGTKSTGRA